MRTFQLAVIAAVVVSSVLARSALEDKPITKVVKLLQGMLEKSKVDGERDTELFAKYKCYCDTNTVDKKTAIEAGTASIALLGAEIGELQGSNGKLSTQHSELEVAMSDNERSRATADSLRSKANADFIAEESDLTAAVGQMTSAIETLAAVGADQTAFEQTANAGADKEKFMAGKGSGAPVLLDVKLKKALGLAAILLPKKQQSALTALLQAPFAGAYSSQSGEIVGIIKSMADTFKSNLASARTSEAASLEAHEKLSKVKTDEHAKMQAMYDESEDILGRNDNSLSTKKTQKTDSETSLADDEEFLAKLTKLCADKTAEYENRKMMRANEDAAISQATAILNSDASFDNPATSFLQINRAVKIAVREEVTKKLSHEAKAHRSLRLARVAVALENGNPFDKVVDEIDKMIELIAKEEKADDEQKDWCDSEREESHSQKSDRISSINSLNGEITSLIDGLDGERTGLRKQLADEEATLAQNKKDQAETVADRTEENGVYQGNVANLVEAEKTVKKGLKVLTKFYEWLHKKTAAHHYDKKAGKDSGGSNIERVPGASTADLEEACSADPSCSGFTSNGMLKTKIQDDDKLLDSSGDLYVKVFDEANSVGGGAFLQQKKEDPAPPEGFSEEKGQTGQANEVVSQLEFIVQETATELKTAHETEETDQHDFEDEITTLKSQASTSQDTIASLEDQIAEKEKALLAAQEGHKSAEKEKKALEGYLLKIKPGCDFITTNLDQRKSNRAAETTSLNTAMQKLKDTPAFKEAAAEAEKAAMGKCGEKCIPDRETLACKACIQGTSESGYCASHGDHAEC